MDIDERWRCARDRFLWILESDSFLLVFNSRICNTSLNRSIWSKQINSMGEETLQTQNHEIVITPISTLWNKKGKSYLSPFSLYMLAMTFAEHPTGTLSRAHADGPNRGRRVFTCR